MDHGTHKGEAKTAIVLVPPLAASSRMLSGMMAVLYNAFNGPKPDFYVIEPHGKLYNDLLCRGYGHSVSKRNIIYGFSETDIGRATHREPMEFDATVYRFVRTPSGLDEYARLLAEVLQEIGKEHDRVIAVGHSMGGIVVSILASNRDKFGLEETNGERHKYVMISVNPPFDRGVHRLIPEMIVGMGRWALSMLWNGIYLIPTAQYFGNMVRHLRAYLRWAKDLERLCEISGTCGSVLSPERKEDYIIVASKRDIFNTHTRRNCPSMLEPYSDNDRRSMMIVGEQNHAAFINLGYDKEITGIIIKALSIIGEDIRNIEINKKGAKDGFFDGLLFPFRIGYNFVKWAKESDQLMLPPMKNAKYWSGLALGIGAFLYALHDWAFSDPNSFALWILVSMLSGNAKYIRDLQKAWELEYKSKQRD